MKDDKWWITVWNSETVIPRRRVKRPRVKCYRIKRHRVKRPRVKRQTAKTQQLVKRRRVKSAKNGQNFIWTIFWVILTIFMLIRTSSRSSRPPSLSALVLSPEISELNLTLK